jgi:CelD/BcsL family acetyltransferase involved in cellulose biosynthesis
MNRPQALQVEHRPFSRLSEEDLLTWRNLLAQAAPGGAFFSPAYARAVHETGRAELRIVLLHRAGVLVGVMGLQRAHGWLGRLGLFEPLGGAMTDYFGLVATPDVVTDWRSLLKGAGVPCLYFTHLDESQRAHGLPGDAPRVGLRTVIHADGGAAHWQALRPRDKKLVSDTERRERKLFQDHGEPVFRLMSDQPLADLRELVQLKNAQYLRTGKEGGALLDAANVKLLEALLQDDDPHAQPRLSTLKVGDRLVAGHFGLQCAGTLHYWFPVYDEAFAAYSPGRLLMKHVLHAASEAGIRVIDRGEGDSAAKREFATESHEYFKGLVHREAWGWMLSTALRISWRARR